MKHEARISRRNCVLRHRHSCHVRRGVGPLFILALLCSSAHVCTSAKDYIYSALEAWVIQAGGQINTTVKENSQGVRGLFTTVDVEYGQTLATIPSACMMNVAAIESVIVEGTLQVLRELKDPHSRFKPYLDAMPKPGELLCECNLPRKYWSMLESQYWESRIANVQDLLVSTHAGENNLDLPWTIPELVGSANVTLDDVKYACSLMATRALSIGERDRIMLVPIFDFANAYPNCPHTTTELGAGNSISLLAGVPMKAGDEWCYPYTHNLMRDDYAVVQYGFLPELHDPPLLLLVDHHEFHGTGDKYVSDERFTGNAEQLEVELQRQQATLDKLLENDKRVRPPGPAPGTDYAYDLLRSLQERRRNALRYEVARLELELQRQLERDSLTGPPDACPDTGMSMPAWDAYGDDEEEEQWQDDEGDFPVRRGDEAAF